MSDQPFGSYAPSHFARLIMRATQDMPYNGFGRKMALFIRKLALVQKQKIYDVVIDGIKIRAHLRDNISERKFVFMPQFCDPYERTFMKDILNFDKDNIKEELFLEVFEYLNREELEIDKVRKVNSSLSLML